MKDKDWYLLGGLFVLALFAKDLGRGILVFLALGWLVYHIFGLIRIFYSPGGRKEDESGKRVAAFIHICFYTVLLLAFLGVVD